MEITKTFVSKFAENESVAYYRPKFDRVQEILFGSIVKVTFDDVINKFKYLVELEDETRVWSYESELTSRKEGIMRREGARWSV